MSPTALSSRPEVPGRGRSVQQRAHGDRSRALPPRATALLRAAAAAAGLLALWRLHPAVPDVPDSLDAPLTTETITDLTVAAAWLLLACSALLVLVRALRAARSVDPARPLRLDAAARSATPPAASPAPGIGDYILTVARRDEPPPVPETAVTEEPSAPAAEIAAAFHSVESPQISLLLLGPVSLEGTKRPRRTSTRELLAYLALRPEGANRDQLVEALWPAQDPRRTKPRFWQSVSEARRLLGDAFIRDGDHYRLDRDRIRIDADELARLLARANRATEPDRERRLLEQALDLWRGEPLEGSDWLWADADLPALRAGLVELIERVARLRLEAGDARGALQAAERGLTLDDFNESLWRLALEAEGALGLREAVAERYERLCRALGDSLGLEPDSETRALHRRLLAQG